MKPIFSTRPVLTVAILSISLLSSSIVANADNHNKGNHGNNKHRSEYRDEGNYRAYSNDRDDRRERNYRHYKDYRNDDNCRAYRHEERDYYDHPRYGRVYERFEHKPYVLRCSHGDYYYTDNRFYTYHDGVGYCVAEPPRNVYFRELPFHCQRVYSDGCEYYRNGDLFFRLSTRGYIMVPAPVEFNVSIRF
ncbi:MAG: hypothetical protein ACM3P1_13715 [Candidatus Saccharibacteria bacterium]